MTSKKFLPSIASRNGPINWLLQDELESTELPAAPGGTTAVVGSLSARTSVADPLITKKAPPNRRAVTPSDCASLQGARSRALQAVQLWWMPVEAALRSRHVMKLTAAVHKAQDVRLRARLERMVQRSSSLGARQRSELGSIITSRISQARCVLTKWQMAVKQLHDAREEGDYELMKRVLVECQFSSDDAEIDGFWQDVRRWEDPTVFETISIQDSVARLSTWKSVGPDVLELLGRSNSCSSDEPPRAEPHHRRDNGVTPRLTNLLPSQLQSFEGTYSVGCHVDTRILPNVRAGCKTRLKEAALSGDRSELELALGEARKNRWWRLDKRDPDLLRATEALQKHEEAQLQLRQLVAERDLPAIAQALARWQFARDGDEAALAAEACLEGYIGELRAAVAGSDGWAVQRLWAQGGQGRALIGRSDSLLQDAAQAHKRHQDALAGLRCLAPCHLKRPAPPEASADAAAESSESGSGSLAAAMADWPFMADDPNLGAVAAMALVHQKLMAQALQVLESLTCLGDRQAVSATWEAVSGLFAGEHARQAAVHHDRVERQSALLPTLELLAIEPGLEAAAGRDTAVDNAAGASLRDRQPQERGGQAPEVCGEPTTLKTAADVHRRVLAVLRSGDARFAGNTLMASAWTLCGGSIAELESRLSRMQDQELRCRAKSLVSAAVLSSPALAALPPSQRAEAPATADPCGRQPARSTSPDEDWRGSSRPPTSQAFAGGSDNDAWFGSRRSPTPQPQGLQQRGVCTPSPVPRSQPPTPLPAGRTLTPSVAWWSDVCSTHDGGSPEPLNVGCFLDIVSPELRNMEVEAADDAQKLPQLRVFLERRMAKRVQKYGPRRSTEEEASPHSAEGSGADIPVGFLRSASPAYTAATVDSSVLAPLADVDLEEEDMISGYQPSPSTRLWQQSAFEAPLQVLVTSRDGSVDLQLAVAPDATVGAVRHEVSQATGTPREQQLLYLRGRSLQGEMTLRECGIEDAACLELLVLATSLPERTDRLLQQLQARHVGLETVTVVSPPQGVAEPALWLVNGKAATAIQPPPGASKPPSSPRRSSAVPQPYLRAQSLKERMREVLRAIASSLSNLEDPVEASGDGDASQSLPSSQRTSACVEKAMHGWRRMSVEPVALTATLIQEGVVPISNLHIAEKASEKDRGVAGGSAGGAERLVVSEFVAVVKSFYVDVLLQRTSHSLGVAAALAARQARASCEEALQAARRLTPLCKPPHWDGQGSAEAFVTEHAEIAMRQMLLLAASGVPLVAAHVEYVRQAIDVAGQRFLNRPPTAQPLERLRWTREVLALQTAAIRHLRSCHMEMVRQLREPGCRASLVALVDAATVVCPEALRLLHLVAEVTAVPKAATQTSWRTAEDLLCALGRHAAGASEQPIEAIRCEELQAKLSGLWRWIATGCEGQTALLSLSCFVALALAMQPLLEVYAGLKKALAAADRCLAQLPPQEDPPPSEGGNMVKGVEEKVERAWPSLLFLLDSGGREKWWWLQSIRVFTPSLVPWIDAHDGSLGVSLLELQRKEEARQQEAQQEKAARALKRRLSRKAIEVPPTHDEIVQYYIDMELGRDPPMLVPKILPPPQSSSPSSLASSDEGAAGNQADHRQHPDGRQRDVGW
eukprot:TRINITY_DN16817_c0_g1_i1.p1 TRINITY_DN16817_c0_g1~~TRINITY_DN16817_c0_g1_i1.p1  ORF type:complete len:1622 (-),score=375.26 TRINITY_DN16817_c0_g1_i1:92-4957(-)